MRLLLSILSLAAFAHAAEPNTLTDEEKAGGWKLLFDGKTTTGWRAIGKQEFPAKGWVVEDGALKHLAKGGGGDIVTVDEYESFELKWEWKISPGGNSGIKYNLPDPNKGVGCEYQMLDDEKHADGKVAGGKHRTASLYDLIAPPPDTKVKVGEWNESRIVANGNKVEHWLNGAKIVEFELSSEAMKELVANSKYKKVPGFGIKKKSPLLIQDHGDAVEVRSMKLKPL